MEAAPNLMETSGMGFFRAAVLIPLVWTNSGPQVVFEVRAGNMSWQPGEVCFPGGRIEDDDNGAWGAAVRETVEELGIKPGDISIIGEMGEIVSPIGVILKPVVGRITTSSFQLNRQEVAEVFTVPLAQLQQMSPQTAHMEMGNRPQKDFPYELVPSYTKEWMRRRTYEVVFYSYQTHVIWGLTGYVLQRFLKICRHIQ